MATAMIAINHDNNSFASVVKKIVDGKTYICTNSSFGHGKVYDSRLLLNAAILAVKSADEKDLEVITDNRYLKTVLNNYKYWLKNNRQTRQMIDQYGTVIIKEHDVANWDLICQLEELIKQKHVNVTVTIGKVTPAVQKIADDFGYEDDIDSEANGNFFDTIPWYNDESLIMTNS